jgi:hypothetical protein
VGEFVCGFVLGEPSLRQPSGGFLVCQRGHRPNCSVSETQISTRESMARCVKFFAPGWHILAVIYLEPGGRRMIPILRPFYCANIR